jgi:hypothetical protein
MKEILMAIESIRIWYQQQYTLMRIWFWFWCIVTTIAMLLWATKP